MCCENDEKLYSLLPCPCWLFVFSLYTHTHTHFSAASLSILPPPSYFYPRSSRGWKKWLSFKWPTQHGKMSRLSSRSLRRQRSQKRHLHSAVNIQLSGLNFFSPQRCFFTPTCLAQAHFNSFSFPKHKVVTSSWSYTDGDGVLCWHIRAIKATAQ